MRTAIVGLIVALATTLACVATTPPDDGSISATVTEGDTQLPTRQGTVTATLIAGGTPDAGPDATPTATQVTAGLPVCRRTDRANSTGLILSFVADWDGDWEIYHIQADGSGLFQLTDNDTDDVDVQWSPDGSQVGFVVDFVREPRLHVTAADGAGERTLAGDLEVSSGLVWSPDGLSIVFRSVDDLYSVNVGTGETTKLTVGADYGPGLPSFSPDGSRMVIPAAMRTGTPGHRMVIADADGSDLAELSFPQGDVSWPSWHPFRDLVLFEGITDTEGSGVYIANLEGSISRLAIDQELRPSLPAWSPDGSMIAYHAWDSPPTLGGPARHSIRVRTEDSSIDIAVIDPGEDPEAELNISRFSWGPDSRHLAYTVRSTTNGEDTLGLLVLDICEGTSVTVAQDIANQFGVPSWRPLP